MEITKELIRIFTDWTKLKIRIHLSTNLAFPNKKEIWWVSLGQNIGVETNGKNQGFERPALVIKVFNQNSALIAPISSKIKSDKYKVEFVNGEGEENIVNLSQLKTISSQRFIRKIGDMKEIDFAKIVETLKNFF